MPSRAFLFLIVSLLVASVAAQTAEDASKRIRQAVAERRYADAIVDLQKLKAEQPGVFDANNYTYLLGRLAEQTGDLATAAASYQAATENSALKPYALWHLSKIARASGNLVLERAYLQQITEFSPNSLLAPAAGSRLLQSSYESGDYRRVIAILTSPQNAAAADPKRAEQVKRQNLVMLGDAYFGSGDAAKASEIYTQLITSMANPAQPDDAALGAAKGLDAIDAARQAAGTTEQLSDYEHLRRGSVYQFNRDFGDARRHYAAIVENFPSSGITPDAMFQIGRGFAQEGNFSEAIVWFERLMEQFPEHQASKDALLQDASAYAQLGKYREAVSRYRRFIDTYKEDERLDRAYLNIVDAYRDARQDSEALEQTARIREVFKGKLPEALALFDEAKIYVSKADWPNALQALQNLAPFTDLGAAVPGGTNATEVKFMTAFALENLGRYPEAIDVYLSIPDGRNEYYGWRATERLRLLAAADAARAAVRTKLAALTASASKDKEQQRRELQSAIRLTTAPEERAKLLDALRKLYAEIPAYKNVPQFKMLDLGRQVVRTPKATADVSSSPIADELLFLGLYDEAGPEAETAYKAAKIAGSGSTDLDYTIAVLYNRGSRGDKAAAFIEPLWKLPADYQFELIPRDIALLLYPAPYAESLTKYSAPRGLDPRFLLSIMRQESRFRPEVKSYAAARGLMQFVSSTSNRIAAELGIKGFVQDDLYDPPTAILFGSQYLSDLFEMFPGQPQAVAASYNGGENGVRRWMNRSRSGEPDNYVPEVVYAQSKDYVYRVMANYRVYQYLYDAELRPR